MVKKHIQVKECNNDEAAPAGINKMCSTLYAWLAGLIIVGTK